MGKYVMAYKGGSIPQTEEEQKSVMDAWTAWFAGSATRSSTWATRSARRPPSAAAPRRASRATRS